MVGLKEGICEANVCIPKSNAGQSSIDFPSNSNKKETVECKHFSIRGYVADIRRKDLKICWPFSPPGENEGLGQLVDVLPPLDIPKFKFWDCKKCVHRSDASNKVEDVSSVVLETICMGRKDAANTSIDVNGSENCPMVHGPTEENGAITKPDIEGYILVSNDNNAVVRGVDKTLKKQNIRELKDTQPHKVNLNLETCASFGFEGINCGIPAHGATNLAKTWQDLEKANFVSFRRRKFRPCESSDDEEDVHNLHGQCSANHLTDPSKITSFKRPQKVRLLSDILREGNSGLPANISDSKWGTNSGDVSTKIDQTKALYTPDSLVLYNQTNVGNGMEKKNKKEKAHQDEDNNLLLVRCSKSLGKSHFYQRDQEENGSKYSDGFYINSESHFPKNGKDRQVSPNHIDGKEPLFENRRQQHDIPWQGFANAGNANHKTMSKKRGFEHVAVTTGYRGIKNKGGSLQKHSMSPEQKSTYQTQEGASPMRSKDPPFICNSEKKNHNQTEFTRNQNNDRANEIGESEALDEISLGIVELLAKSRLERRCQEVQNADQIKLRGSKKTVNEKISDNVSWVWKENFEKIRKTCKSNNFDEKQMPQSLDKKGSLASSSSHLNHFDGIRFVVGATGDKLGGQCCRWGDTFVNKNQISYPQGSTSHPNHQMISHPTETQGANHVSPQSKHGDDIGVHEMIRLEQPCACTQKKISNFAKPDTYTNRYMPATELLQLMDAGMCPKVPRVEKLNQLPIEKTGYSKEQSPFSCGSQRDLSKLELSNSFNKDHSNLGMYCYPSSPMMYPAVYPVHRYENSALSSRIKESRILVSETATSPRRKKGKNSRSSLEVDCELKKPSGGNEYLSKKQDPFSTCVKPSKLGSVSLEPRLSSDSIASVWVGNDKVATLHHMNGNLGLEICSVNRNPADFTVPGRGNHFMIGSRELKIGKTISKRGRPRKRTMEVPNLSEHAHN